MDPERSLISKTIQTGDLREVIARGIDADHFYDPECADIYDYMSEFLGKHGQPPSAQVVRVEFPDFSPVVSQDPLSYHMEIFVNTVKERMATELVRDFAAALEDPDEIPEIDIRALEMARSLTEVVPAPRAMRYSEMPLRVQEQIRRQEKGELHGIMLGIPTIDKVMLGTQPHELVTVVAYSGKGKTTLMQHIAYSFYLQGKTVLFISLEVEGEQIMRKIDTMATNVKYQAIKALELETGDIEQWKKIADKAHEDRHERDIIVRDDIRNCSVDRVMAETMRYKPDLVIVDYLELMSTPRSAGSQHWEKVSVCVEGMKQNARVLRIPHISAAQLDRTGGKNEIGLHNIGYQSVVKNSDTILGMQQDDDQEASHELDVILLKYRDGPRNLVAPMNWQLDRMVIKEKGIEERFPVRKGHKSQTTAERRKLEIKRNIDEGGRGNPLLRKARRGAHVNPLTARARASARR